MIFVAIVVGIAAWLVLTTLALGLCRAASLGDRVLRLPRRIWIRDLQMADVESQAAAILSDADRSTVETVATHRSAVEGVVLRAGEPGEC
jgi:uncharacterized membrane protein